MMMQAEEREDGREKERAKRGTEAGRNRPGIVRHDVKSGGYFIMGAVGARQQITGVSLGDSARLVV